MESPENRTRSPATLEFEGAFVADAPDSAARVPNPVTWSATNAPRGRPAWRVDLDTVAQRLGPCKRRAATGVGDAAAPESEAGTSRGKATGCGEQRERRERGWVPGDAAELLGQPGESPPLIPHEVRANAFVF